MSAVLYSVQLIWAHHWIDLKKLPQIDPSNIEIHLYRELNQQNKFYKPYQTICIDNKTEVTSVKLVVFKWEKLFDILT